MSNSTVSRTEVAPALSVDHEWGTLREVVCGIPNFRIPTSLPDVIYNYAPDEGLRFMEANLGLTLAEADPDVYQAVSEQMNAVVDILEDRGVIVHRPAEVTDDENAYLERIFPDGSVQFFPRDPMLVIGNRFIETEPMLPARRRERFGIRRAIEGRLTGSGAEIVSIPPAIPSREADGSWGPGPFLEGGDVFLLGRDILVGVSGNATNEAGVEWLAGYLGDEYRVHSVRLSPDFLHLDCALGTPRPGLALICREAFTDGIPELLEDWTFVDVGFKDAKQRLATNGLVVDESTIIMASGLDHIAADLRAAGQEVIETPFDAVYQYAGAFRCWHHPLVRESD